MSAPSGGLIAGQGTLINLNGSTQAEMSVEPTVALVVNFPRVAQGGGFGGGFGGFGGGQQLDFNEAMRRRDTQVEELKKIFTASLNHAKAMEAYAKDKSLPLFRPPQHGGDDPVRARRKADSLSTPSARCIKAVIKFISDMK